MSWREETKQAYSSSLRCVHESERAFFQGIAELYKLDWIKTVRTKRLYLERVAFYGACCRFRLGIAQLETNDVVLMWIRGGQGDEIKWTPYMTELFNKNNSGIMHSGPHIESEKRLIKTSHIPAIWNIYTGDTDIIDLLDHSSNRIKNNFATLLKEWVKVT